MSLVSDKKTTPTSLGYGRRWRGAVQNSKPLFRAIRSVKLCWKERLQLKSRYETKATGQPHG